VEIRRVTEIQEVLKCLPFEREIRNKGRDDQRESKMLLFVQSQLQNPLFGFFMAYDENENVKGYIVTMISLMPGLERLHILRIYAKDGLMKEFEEVLKEWAKQFRLKTALMTVSDSRMVKAMQRRYGYKVVSVNMERRYL
jgi:hypothetical protein